MKVIKQRVIDHLRGKENTGKTEEEPDIDISIEEIQRQIQRERELQRKEQVSSSI